MNKYLIVGAFGYINNQLDGQTIKTRMIYKLISDKSGISPKYIDTIAIKRNPLIVFRFLRELWRCSTLIIIPCLNNLTYLFPIVYYLSFLLKYEIINICVGGWQVEYFMGNEKYKKHKCIMSLCKKVKVFMPELHNVDEDLKKVCSFKNTVVFPNFRFFERKEYTHHPDANLRLVYFGRINRNKGYETIIKAAELFETQHLLIKIDFYGQIEEEDKNDFLELVNSHATSVEYMGVLPFDVLYETLSTYDLLLFPTKYYTEGFPGCILDAYIAGIPVAVSEWKHSHEFVKDSETGFIIPFENNQDSFNRLIIDVYNNREQLIRMRELAKKESFNYSDEAAWSIIHPYL
jgi:glycosyltransferase involved in cell wall biosynthesis